MRLICWPCIPWPSPPQLSEQWLQRKYFSDGIFSNLFLTCIGGLGDIGPASVGDGVEVLGHASQLRFPSHPVSSCAASLKQEWSCHTAMPQGLMSQGRRAGWYIQYGPYNLK